MLVDSQILEALAGAEIAVDPFKPEMLQPASIDVRLGRTILIQKDGGATDPRQDSTKDWEPWKLDPFVGRAIRPGDFFLGTTYERVALNEQHAARFEGKSSLGRIGLLTHITAGFIDPGFSGHITVELANVSTKPIILYPGMKIGQLCFHRLDRPATAPYGSTAAGSHYQGQHGPQPSRIHENFHQTRL